MAMTRRGKKLVLSSPGGAAAYAIGDYKDYTSIYGYPKRYVKVHKVMPGEALDRSNEVGLIKEERILGPDGTVAGVCFYEKNSWRPHGQTRFFNTPEALLIACGMTPILGLDADSETTEMARETAQADPTETVSALPPELQGRLTHGAQLVLPPPKAQLLLHAPDGGSGGTQLVLASSRKARPAKVKKASKKIKAKKRRG